MAKGWKRVWILGLMAWNAVAGTGAMAVDNPLGFVAALARNGVPVEAHVFEKGGHGPPAFQKNPSWESALEDWLRRRDVLPAKTNPSP